MYVHSLDISISLKIIAWIARMPYGIQNIVLDIGHTQTLLSHVENFNLYLNQEII